MLKQLFEDDDFYCVIRCDCGRRFKSEDMYICYVCNKIRCRYCTKMKYERYHCKGGCGHYVDNESRKKRTLQEKKNCCPTCLECPLCLIPLQKRLIYSKYMLVCTSCHWNSVKLICRDKEADLDSLISMIYQEYCSGFLRKMYDYVYKKLSQDPMFINRPKKMTFELANETLENKNDETVKKAMDENDWSLEKLQQQIKEDIASKEKTYNNIYEYTDDYYKNEGKNYVLINVISKALACNNDYDKNINTLEDVKKAFNSDYHVNSMTSLEQRHENVFLQNISKLSQYPKFVDLVPQDKKSVKNCIECDKPLTEVSDIIQKSGSSSSILHTFISQLPTVTIYKINVALNKIMLKFTLYKDKDLTISFIEDPENNVKVNLPPEKYHFGEKGEIENVQNEFLVESKKKYLIFDFQIKEEYQSKLLIGSEHILRFRIKAEFSRDSPDNMNIIEYGNEIKFKIK